MHSFTSIITCVHYICNHFLRWRYQEDANNEHQLLATFSRWLTKARVSHLWHERRCRPPQMRMRAKPAPLYYSQQTGSAKGRRRKKKTAPGRWSRGCFWVRIAGLEPVWENSHTDLMVALPWLQIATQEAVKHTDYFLLHSTSFDRIRILSSRVKCFPILGTSFIWFAYILRQSKRARLPPEEVVVGVIVMVYSVLYKFYAKLIAHFFASD